MHWLLPRQCAWEMRRENFRPHGERAGLGPGTFRSELRPSTTALELTAFLKVRGEAYSGKEIVTSYFTKPVQHGKGRHRRSGLRAG